MKLTKRGTGDIRWFPNGGEAMLSAVQCNKGHDSFVWSDTLPVPPSKRNPRPNKTRALIAHCKQDGCNPVLYYGGSFKIAQWIIDAVLNAGGRVVCLGDQGRSGI